MWNETLVSIIDKSPSGALLIEGGLSCCILFVVHRASASTFRLITSAFRHDTHS